MMQISCFCFSFCIYHLLVLFYWHISQEYSVMVFLYVKISGKKKKAGVVYIYIDDYYVLPLTMNFHLKIRKGVHRCLKKWMEINVFIV